MDGVRHVRHETAYGHPARNHPSAREAAQQQQQQQPRHSTSIHSSTAGGGPGIGVRPREVRETRRSVSNPVIIGSGVDTRSGGRYFSSDC